MAEAAKLRIVIIKPSKYSVAGDVERFRRGFMPNSTVPYLRSMTPSRLDDTQIQTVAIDEYVQTDLRYLDYLHQTDHPTLLALVGVQSHQFQRSLDLAAYARANGVRHCVIGGPHPMTCDTSMFETSGVSFALAEAEMIWTEIIRDAIRGELKPVYGRERRWEEELDPPVVTPLSAVDVRRYIVPMMGIYPARGCPFTCNFCSVIKIAGRQIRSQSVETTMATLRATKAAGLRMVMFTSDNFNKYPDAPALLEQMIEEKIGLPFFVQCDTQVARQEEFIALLGKAGCFQMFVGVESFNRKTLIAARKAQNHPELYGDIVRLCRKYGFTTHFSNIIGFPEDTRATVQEHLRVLEELSPDIASFYILTPIPGTDQYDDFLAAGLINETNLDRFDGTAPTWRHPNFSHRELQSLLFDCYRNYFRASRVLRNTLWNLNRENRSYGTLPGFGLPIFSRYSVWKGMHPMAGGIWRVRRDTAEDYRDLRKQHYGFDLVPLPRSLELSNADKELNRKAKLAI
jgi:hypothetical protein